MKINLTGVENIIFDLGNVIVNLDFDATIKAFRKLGSDSDVMNHKNSYANSTFYNIETGRISTAEFFANIRTILNNPKITDNQINDAWCAMFLDTPAKRVKKLQKLSDNYNLYVFSNTNKLHIDRFVDDFRKEHGIEFSPLFKKIFYSHDIHARKPDISAFEKVIELSGVKPEETLFIDDLEQNIEGAQKTGMKTFWLKKGMKMEDLL